MFYSGRGKQWTCEHIQSLQFRIRARKWKKKIIRCDIKLFFPQQSLLLPLVLTREVAFMWPSWALHFSLPRIRMVRACQRQWAWMYFTRCTSTLLETCFPYQESYQILLNYESFLFKEKIYQSFYFLGGGMPTSTTGLCPEYCFFFCFLIN